MGFSSQEYWSVLSLSSPGDLPGPEIEPHLLCFLHWQVGSLPLAPLGKWGLEEVLKCHSCLQILASLMPPSKISPDIHLVKLYIFINRSWGLRPGGGEVRYPGGAAGAMRTELGAQKAGRGRPLHLLPGALRPLPGFLGSSHSPRGV